MKGILEKKRAYPFISHLTIEGKDGVREKEWQDIERRGKACNFRYSARWDVLFTILKPLSFETAIIISIILIRR